MPFAVEDKCAIKVLRTEERGAKRICKEFAQKQWSVNSVKKLISKIDKTGSIVHAPRSGRPMTARTATNIDTVADLVCSQEGQPGTGKCLREIEIQTGISRSSVRHIIRHDLKLKFFKRKKAQLLSDADRKKRSHCCRILLQRRSLNDVAKIWFSSEKVFTVQPPINTQNDRLYDTAVRKSLISSTRLVRGREHQSECDGDGCSFEGWENAYICGIRWGVIPVIPCGEGEVVEC